MYGFKCPSCFGKFDFSSFMRDFLILLFLCFSFSLGAQSWKPVNGSKDSRNHYTAFVNAHIFISSEQQVSNATLLIKNDRIVAVGETVALPENTLLIDAKGQFIYPSFIDLYSPFGIQTAKGNTKQKQPQLESNKKGAFYWNESIKAENNAIDHFKFNPKQAKKYRAMGFGAILSHSMDGIIRGTSGLFSLAHDTDNGLLRDEVAMHYSFFKGSSKQTYPNSLMGIIALLRQSLYDAQWYAENQEKTIYNKSLQALVEHKDLPQIMDAGNTNSILRADKIGDEFGFQFILKGNGREYERIHEIKATEAPIIVPINFPKPYDLSDPYDALKIPLSKLKEWELADKNLKWLCVNDIPFSISSDGLKTSKEFLENIKTAIKSGADRKKVIQGLTQTPAQLLHMEEDLGSLEPGKFANFIISSDSLFTQKSKILSNWVQGKEYLLQPNESVAYEGNYSLNINRRLQFEVSLKRTEEQWKVKVSEKNKEDFVEGSFNAINNRIVLSFTLNEQLYRLSGSANDAQSRIWSGKTQLEGEWLNWAAIKKLEGDQKVKAVSNDSIQETAIIEARVLYPNMAYGWDSLPKMAETIIFRNATIWTNEKEGILKNHDLIIHQGKILMVGYKINLNVMYPKLVNSVQEVDATGKHLTCGIIDEHSHIAIERGVNESGQANTAEVSIGDVVNPADINIYRQLAGGVTTSQLLHGSANPIGGQSALIKLKWGATAEEMKIDSASGFIKFALGENVKQSNWGDSRTVRFPQTRMGVEQVFYDAFIRAREYQAEWKLYNAKSKKDKKLNSPPRVDLELEALAEILDTQRYITCHSYLQSEINMLMHVADSMYFRVNTFTHVLEGYKVAEKLKEHGAAASTFSDWWAYKFEVNDAIPYNGAILHQQGVLTGFNSDDAEMGRRLNQEAAKAVKYGGVSEEEAWKFVTLNPAIMLHLDHKIGSIKAGKDADLVIWNDHPLSVYAKVEQTYVDGIAYFDVKRDLEMRKKIKLEKERIIALMMAEKKKGKASQKLEQVEKKLYHCDTIENAE